MVREFKLPDVGEGVAEGEIVNWLVEAGDPVEEDQVVAEVETDKTVADVPSPVNGSVAELRAEEGEIVPVGDVIIVFNVEGEEQQKKDTESEDGGPTDTAETDTDTSSRVFAAPSARRLARELGVDISAVDGSGPGGRISGSDVRAHAEGTEPASNTAETSEATDVERVTEDVSDTTTPRSVPSSAADREQTLAAPATRKLAEEHEIDINTVPTDEEHDGQPFVTPEQVRSFAETQQAAQQADAHAMQTTGPSEREERIPYRGIRRTIGKQMERSKYTAPHVTHHDEVDVTELVETRSDLKQVADEQGVSLTYMPFVMKAVVAGLKEFPYLNSSLDETSDEIILKNYYNIGVGVATDAGLMVPVVDDVDRKGLLQIASEMNERVLKARERSITREEMQGGTFTITNFGAVGGEYATPIINYPETAILGLGEIKEKPRVVDGEVVPRKVMTLSLSIDHRVIDGAIAGQFANTVKRYLNNPSLLLLE